MSTEIDVEKSFSLCWKCGKQLHQYQVIRQECDKKTSALKTKKTWKLKCNECGAETSEFNKIGEAESAAVAINKYYDDVKASKK